MPTLRFQQTQHDCQLVYASKHQIINAPWTVFRIETISMLCARISSMLVGEYIYGLVDEKDVPITDTPAKSMTIIVLHDALLNTPFGAKYPRQTHIKYLPANPRWMRDYTNLVTGRSSHAGVITPLSSTLTYQLPKTYADLHGAIACIKPTPKIPFIYIKTKSGSWQKQLETIKTLREQPYNISTDLLLKYTDAAVVVCQYEKIYDHRRYYHVFIVDFCKKTISVDHTHNIYYDIKNISETIGLLLNVTVGPPKRSNLRFDYTVQYKLFTVFMPYYIELASLMELIEVTNINGVETYHIIAWGNPITFKMQTLKYQGKYETQIQFPAVKTANEALLCTMVIDKLCELNVHTTDEIKDPIAAFCGLDAFLAYEELWVKQKYHIDVLRSKAPRLYPFNGSRMNSHIDYDIIGPEDPQWNDKRYRKYKFEGLWFACHPGFAMGSIINTLSNQDDFPVIPSSREIKVEPYTPNTNQFYYSIDEERQNVTNQVLSHKIATLTNGKRSAAPLQFAILAENSNVKYELEGVVFSEDLSILHVLLSALDENYKIIRDKMAEAKNDAMHEFYRQQAKQHVSQWNFVIMEYAKTHPNLTAQESQDINANYAVRYRRVFEYVFQCNLIMLKQPTIAKLLLDEPELHHPYVRAPINENLPTVIAYRVTNQVEYACHTNQYHNVVWHYVSHNTSAKITMNTSRYENLVRIFPPQDDLVVALTKSLSLPKCGKIADRHNLKHPISQYLSSDGIMLGLCYSTPAGQIWLLCVCEANINLPNVSKLIDEELIEWSSLYKDTVVELDIRNEKLYGVWYDDGDYVPVRICARPENHRNYGVKICLMFSRYEEDTRQTRENEELSERWLYDLAILMLSLEAPWDLITATESWPEKHEHLNYVCFTHFQTYQECISFYSKRFPYLFDGNQLLVHKQTYAVLEINRHNLEMCLQLAPYYKRSPQQFSHHVELQSWSEYQNYTRTIACTTTHLVAYTRWDDALRNVLCSCIVRRDCDWILESVSEEMLRDQIVISITLNTVHNVIDELIRTESLKMFFIRCNETKLHYSIFEASK